MTGNIALDVAIGLVFIYLLYSLLTTIICEIIASVFALRARNLQDAISKMLVDDNDESSKLITYIKSIWHSIKKIFCNKPTGLAKDFYNQPSIKYLSKNNRIKKPSYIGADNFSQTLINILEESGTGGSQIEKIKNVLSSDLINDETKKHISNLLKNSKDDIEEFKANLESWFDQTMERAIGWYKRKNQLVLFLVGLTIAICFNVNTFYIAKTLSKDDKARSQLVELANSYQKEHQALQSTTSDSAGVERIQELLSVKDSIQKDIQVANYIIGLGWKPNNLIDQGYYKSVLKHPGSGNAWSNLLGWIVTALALSMGATFWFDLLNKMVNLRTSLASSPKSKTKGDKQKDSNH